MRLPFFVHAVIQCITAQLQDRQLRLESAGFIAQAALEMNNVFAAAQAAADDYLHSVQASLADTNATATNTLSQARSEAKRIPAILRAAMSCWAIFPTARWQTGW